MQASEKTALVEALGLFIVDQIRAATEPLVAKIAGLEQKLVALESRPVLTKEYVDESVLAVLPEVRDGAPGRDGKDADEESIFKRLMVQVTEALETWPKPRDGKDAEVNYGRLSEIARDVVLEFFKDNPVKDGAPGRDADPEEIKQVVVDTVRQHFETNPVLNGKDGTSVTPEEVLPTVLLATESTLTKLFEEWPKPKDGKDGENGTSVSLEFVKEWIINSVGEYFKANPVVDGKNGENGKDGTSVGVADVQPLLDDMVDRAVKRLPLPVSVVGTLIDRDGALCTVHSDGTTKVVGPVVGAPGAPGKNGQDGLGFKDMSIVWDGERTITFKFALEDRVEECSIKLPYVYFLGPWKEGTYEQGDQVQRDGSTWIAIRETDKTPGHVDSGWVLSAKKGRDGRDGKSIKGPPGPPGKDGRDLTQMGPDGSKWG